MACLLMIVGLFTLAIGKISPSHSINVADLSSDELQETFGVSNFEEVPEHIQFEPDVDWDENGQLRKLRIGISKMDYELNFESVLNELQSAFMVNVGRNGTSAPGNLRIGRSKNDCHFHHKSNHTYAAMSTCDGNLKGTILRPWAAYVLHPFPKNHQKRSKRSSGLHALYKREVKSNKKTNFCGIKSTLSEEELNQDDNAIYGDLYAEGQRLILKGNLMIELAVFIDQKLWNKFNTNYGSQAHIKLEDYVMMIVSNMQIMYSQPTMIPRVTLKIVRYEVFYSQPNELAGYRHSNGHAETYLDRFCRYQYRLGRSQWDQAMLLTGYNLHRGPGTTSISGLARVRGSCFSWDSCTLAEGLDFTAAFIGTHEIGHSIGMDHDEPYCTNTYIMSSSLGPGKVRWSSCSMRHFHKFMDQLDRKKLNCLRKSYQAEVKRFDRETLPGTVYSANKQCQLVHGQDYKQITPRRPHYDGVCHIMWCSRASLGRYRTSHPALEGTMCGHEKWCRHGRCVPWSQSSTRKQEPKLPIKVHGAWSSWSQVDCRSCQCSSIDSSIGVIRSERRCDNPEPKNGGNVCVGSSVRGFICRTPCKGGRTVHNYVDQICAEHRRSKDDRELTGKGTQLTKYPHRACKPLSCSDRALLPSDLSCPGKFCSVVRSEWTHWSVWSSCSKTCGTGTKARARSCSSQGDCVGESEKTQSCHLAQCPVSVWGDWSPCSVSCGTGYRSRRKDCNFDSSCTGIKHEHRTCSVGYCPWSEWAECSVTCGRGTRRRIRTCPGSGCTGPSYVDEVCNSHSCAFAEWSGWSVWSFCSASCGPGGHKSRTRSCVGVDCPTASETEVGDCYLSPCKYIWNSWTVWNHCSTTCGLGSQARYRHCKSVKDGKKDVADGLCAGETSNVRECNLKSCPSTESWSLWSYWSSCSGTCGQGTRTRMRSCSSTYCKAPSQEQETCANQNECPGSWGFWGYWSSCSRLCGGGQRIRTRVCPNGNCLGPTTKRKSCNPNKCSNKGIWTNWKAWSHCSASCGPGVERRTRSCSWGNGCAGNLRESRQCRLAECAQWGGWGHWSTCTRTCGPGTIRRVRKCYGVGSCPGSLDQVKNCSISNC